jgi:hypothetical protein
MSTPSNNMSAEEQTQTPKQEYKDIMLNIFDLVFNIVEKYPVESNEYKEICDLFKKADLKFDELNLLATQLRNNSYYNRFIRQQHTITRQILTDEQKLNSPNFKLCKCGCFITKEFYKSHLHTAKHFKIMSNKKIVLLNKKNPKNIEQGIKTDITLESMLLKRLGNNNNNV